MNFCKPLNIGLLWRGTDVLSWKIQRALILKSTDSTRGYYSTRKKNGIRFNRKVGKHWNCVNTRNKGLEIIRSRNDGLESEVLTHSDRLFAEDDQGQAQPAAGRVDDASLAKKIFQRSSKNSPPEMNLLTWAAKEQLRFLHQSDPSEWTPERLADCFPISVEGVKKLLSSTFTMDSSERIKLHDLGVLRKWKVLCSESGGPLSADTTGPAHYWKSRMEYAAGNSTLPMPPSKLEDLSPFVAQKCGFFESIIKTEEKPFSKSDTISCDLHVNRSVVPCEPVHYIKHSKSQVMTAEQFMQTMLKELSTTKNSDISDKAKQYQHWITKQIEKLKVKNLPRPTNSVELEKKTVISHKYIPQQQVSLRWDFNKSQKLPEAYVYTNSGGYQQPCGKADDEPLGVKIPRNKRKVGRLYRKGDTFYDDDGEFLYRVPGLK